MVRIRTCFRAGALLVVALAGAGCASIDVGFLNNAHRAMLARPPYTDYPGGNAARIRVIYGRGLADIWTHPDSPGKQGFTVPLGERINKRWMGTMADRAPISLGMPGNPPPANYTEIAVAPGVPLRLSFLWSFSNTHHHSNCAAGADLVPVARGSYEVQFEIDLESRHCRAMVRGL